MTSVRDPAAGTAALGTTRVIETGEISRAIARISARWDLRDAIHLMGPGPGFDRDSDPIGRTRKCGRVRISTNVAVLVEREGMKLARYGGLVICGAIHVCPICSANIRHQRSLEVEHAARAHLAAGGTLVFLTLTVPHSAGMPLADVWGVQSEGWHNCATGRYRKRDQRDWGLVGFIRAVEVTHGANGWHPHTHVLLFLGPSEDPEALAREVEAEWFGRWHTFVTGKGWRAPSRAHGVDARAVTTSTVGDYLVKVQDGGTAAGARSWTPAQELARADLKRGRDEISTTPFGLVERWVDLRELRDLAAWREWEVSSKGRQVLTWSRGLKDLYDVHSVTDQSAAERRGYEADLAYELVPDEYDVVLDAGARWELLEVAAMSGTDGVVAYLVDLLGLDGPEALSCDQCERNNDGLRTRPCNTCGERLRAISGRTDS